jgi:hypothetical protein
MHHPPHGPLHGPHAGGPDGGRAPESGGRLLYRRHDAHKARGRPRPPRHPPRSSSAASAPAGCSQARPAPSTSSAPTSCARSSPARWW